MSTGERDPAVLLRGLVELTRPGNVVAAGVLTATGSFVASGFGGAAVPVVAAVAATVFATAAGNAVNDYFDREVDRVNRPDRPIPRGAVTARGGVAFSGLLFAAAVAAAVALPLAAVAIAVANLLALVAYTKLFKGLPGVGNVVVAYLTGSTFLFGGAAVGRVADPAVVVLFSLAALATLSREIVKTSRTSRVTARRGFARSRSSPASRRRPRSAARWWRLPWPRAQSRTWWGRSGWRTS